MVLIYKIVVNTFYKSISWISSLNDGRRFYSYLTIAPKKQFQQPVLCKIPKGTAKTSPYKMEKGVSSYQRGKKGTIEPTVEAAFSLFDANCVCTLKKMQCPAKLTTYLLFTAGCCTCGFCIHSCLPVKSSVVCGISSDIRRIGPLLCLQSVKQKKGICMK